MLCVHERLETFGCVALVGDDVGGVADDIVDRCLDIDLLESRFYGG